MTGLEDFPFCCEYGHLLPDPAATIVRAPMTVQELVNVVLWHSLSSSPESKSWARGLGYVMGWIVNKLKLYRREI